MLEPTSAKNSIVAAALRVAERRAWNQVTLLEIAGDAGLTLLALKEHFSDKETIVTAFIEAVDAEVLARTKRPDPAEAVRDALFEVIMTRFDVLAPYKAVIRSIAAGLGLDPARIRPLLVSQQWMLEAAGISTSGPQGAVKVLGLASVYASVFRTWLDEDDPGLARTMAALDRRLRRGERSLRRIDELCKAAGRIASLLKPCGPTARQDGGAPNPPAAGAETGPAV